MENVIRFPVRNSEQPEPGDPPDPESFNAILALAMTGVDDNGTLITGKEKKKRLRAV
ncbi:MAG: hypothetical protein ACQR33_02205 [Candidatus Saccharibacteria bacterium]